MAFDESLIQQPEDWDEEENGKWYPDPDIGKREWTALVDVEKMKIHNRPLRSWKVDRAEDAERPTDEYLAWSGFYGFIHTAPPEFDEATQRVEEGEWVRDDQERTFTQSWVVVDLDETEKAEREEFAWHRLRVERDRRLAKSDWTQVEDAPKSMKQEYKSYRQALRDLPENTTDPFSPNWPDEPAPKGRRDK